MNKKDEARALFATAIVASFFGYLQVADELARFMGKAPINTGKLVLGVSSTAAFCYLIFLASEMKHLRPKSLIWLADIPDRIFTKYKNFMYDLSVDSFLLVPTVVLAKALSDYLSSFSSFYGDSPKSTHIGYKVVGSTIFALVLCNLAMDAPTIMNLPVKAYKALGKIYKSHKGPRIFVLFSGLVIAMTVSYGKEAFRLNIILFQASLLSFFILLSVIFDRTD